MTQPPELRERLLDIAEEKMFRLGYRSMSVDSIAAEAGISKKTLYEVFPSKETIASLVIDRMLQRVEQQMEGIFKGTSDPVRKLQLVVTTITGVLSRIQRPAMEDMKKSTPALWERIDRFRREREGYLKRILVDGMEKGVFREDIHPDIATAVYLTSMRTILDPETCWHKVFSPPRRPLTTS
ncbi:MAG: TetR/AcrR family transcriptional regulator [Actinobacteria bacterium]|nr:TetR/AcrR family transcriptional regulator [Actinomycetota bacterium]